MFKSVREGFKYGIVVRELMDFIKLRGYSLVYFPSREAAQLAERYQDVRETIDGIKAEKYFGMTLPVLRLIIVKRTPYPKANAFYLLHEYCHILSWDGSLNQPKLGHTPEFFMKEEEVCNLLDIKELQEYPESYDQNGNYIEGNVEEKEKEYKPKSP
jgi:hypothetical protein